MKHILKQLFAYFMILAISIPYFFTPILVEAKSNANTLAELRKELADFKAKKNSAEYNKSRTQNEISADKTAIGNAQNEIDANKKKIEQSKKDIERLTKEIEETKAKIEEILRAYEISDGDNAYLEYVFDATSISDLIVRYSVSEQLAKYNEELVNGYQSKVEENEQLQKDLNKREKELNTKINELENAIQSLGNKLNSFIEEAVDAEDDIKSTQQLIKYYESMGCGENEDFDTCVRVRAASKLIRPLIKGVISSPYGYRTHPVTGQPNKLHTGIDIAGNNEGTNVYASANGMVGKIIYKASCGGNQVYIYHTVNGVKYTTGYMHLLSIKVSLGQSVTQDTVIGTVGGGKGTSSYEQCSTGAHLHFMIAKGWYGSTYVSYSTFVSNLLDPVKVIPFPARWTYFYTRY